MFGLRGILRPKARWFVPVSFPFAGLRGVRGWFKSSTSTSKPRRNVRRESVGTVTVTVTFK